MNGIGTMGTDWEARIDFERLRERRLEKAQEALRESDLDALFVFRTEDARYLTGFRSHLHPVSFLGNAVVMLIEGEDPILYSMDYRWAREAMTWMDPENVRPRANFREPS
ncbi:MAG: aminopeptidase P family N-terminal domain-containing protein, partial [Halobacteriales archaeon]|nr:aminopeptidase P family N-terminal domain-containing protein [Halobacteriales archaeon]